MTSMQQDTIETQISELQNQYYLQNTKSLFFKNTQKLDCAAEITKNIQLDSLFKKTVFCENGTNRIYFDYIIFKSYGHPTIYDKLVEYILALFNECMDKYGHFEIHINLHSFTITAAQRYKDITCIFCNKCLGRNTEFASHLDNLHIYNPPKMIDTLSNIFAGFIDDSIRSKVILH